MIPNDKCIIGCPKFKRIPQRTVKAGNFVGTLAVNVNNRKLSDKEFRKFVRRTLPIVIYTGA